jgi:arginine utilization protein RocB
LGLFLDVVLSGILLASGKRPPSDPSKSNVSLSELRESVNFFVQTTFNTKMSYNWAVHSMHDKEVREALMIEACKTCQFSPTFERHEKDLDSGQCVAILHDCPVQSDSLPDPL